VDSNENARILLEKDPRNISMYLAKGNERVRASFIAAVSWLTLASKFALANEIFDEQLNASNA
jgi:hypothetical protein